MSPRRRGEEAMVPDAQPTSYYGRPVIKPPVWEERDIAGYLFLGGLAGASGALALGAAATGRSTVARSARLAATGGAALSAVALVHDLGRPSRALNMLRVAKPTSPMSVGSWLLAGFGPAAGVAALSDLTGRLPRVGTLATVAAGVLGPGVAAYTAALVADTAVPAWHDAWAELPVAFVGSGASAAAGLGLVTAPLEENTPLRRAAVAAAAVEQLAMRRVEHGDELSAETYRAGKAGARLRAARALTIGGAVGAAVAGGRSRVAAATSGAALVIGSALTRFGIFAAGVASAEDPRYTTLPQRARADR